MDVKRILFGKKVNEKMHFDESVTKTLHRFATFYFLFMPLLYVTQGITSIKFSIEDTCILAAICAMGWLFTDIALRMGLATAAKYIQLIYLQIIINYIGQNETIKMAMMFFVVPLFSIMYFDMITFSVTTGIAFVLSIVSLYFRCSSLAERGLTGDLDGIEYWISVLISTTIEYVMLIIVGYAIVRYGRRIRDNYFESKKEIIAAEAASSAKSSFLANMSHEIRTPINAVIGMNEMIIRESREKNILQYADNVKNASKNLLEIINDILDFSKIESGKMDIIPVNYSVNSALTSLVDMIRVRAESKNLRLEMDIDERCPSVLYGDEVRLRQVVTNLLTNAVKYTHEGTVTLRVNVTFINDQDKVRLDIAVIDTGIGIKEADMSKLFGTFQRLDEKENRNIEGTGLGLALSAQLLELMGSKLMVNSTYGKGSTFYFGIEQVVVDSRPIGEFNRSFVASDTPVHGYRSSFTAPTAKILVVDDTNLNLEVIKGLLKKTKASIDTADSGRRCIEMLKENTYNVVLLDHKMPEMDGIECVKIIRDEKLVDSSSTKVIALTANAISGAREFYLNSGFDDYLSKPVQSEALEEALCRHLPASMLEEADNDVEVELIEEAKDIPEINGIDKEEALRYAGGDKATRNKSLILYRDEYENKKNTLNECFKNRNWNDYQIHVHALKSTSKTIGAESIYALAARLEEAAANDDVRWIEFDHGVLMDQYSMLVSRIAEAIAFIEPEKTVSELKPISKENVREICDNLRGSLEDYDAEQMMKISESLLDKDLLGDLKVRLKKACEDFDYDAVGDCLKELESFIE